MASRTRLSAEERRKSILTAAIPLFAAKGFQGTTTKMIANAAKVSEALLYRHFPSKESMYIELRDFVCGEKDEILSFLAVLPPSSQTLMLFFHFMVHHLFLHEGEEIHLAGLTQSQMNRLMANSFLEDGEFARLFLDHTLSMCQPILLRCVEVAIAEGEMEDIGNAALQKLWFGHHLAVALSLFNLPEKPVIDYGSDQREVARNAVRFVLRGLGLKSEVIEKYYQPEAFPSVKDMIRGD